MRHFFRCLFFLNVLICTPSLLAGVDGTTGTPLGGLGTGGVKFRAGEGTFTFSELTPTRYTDYRPLEGAAFQLYTNRNGTVVTSNRLTAARQSGRIMDDAIFPTHQVQFDVVNGIDIRLKAFGPFSPSTSDSMTLPCAFYEFTVANIDTSDADVSIAFQMTTGQNPEIVPAKGFIDTLSLQQKCIFVTSASDSMIVSVGGDSDFFLTGVCSNVITGNTNRTAMLMRLTAGEIKSVLFVFAWYTHFDLSRYYYSNFSHNAFDVANEGLSHSSMFKEKAYSFVTRMRDSNLPAWLIDQTMNSLANLVNNSIYTQDGRYCHNEGMFFMNGTMDQMWHARQINIQLLPELAWKELEYWARCQKISAGVEGQIHHDFGSNKNYAIVNWDESEYEDYVNINSWVDLNCGFIISVYEAYIATANQQKFVFFWPYLKKAGQRILDQVVLYGDPVYPLTFATSGSTYDAGGDSQVYNSGLAIVAFKILGVLAKRAGETEEAARYDSTFRVAVESFSRRWLENPFPTGNHCESVLAGPWIANFLKLGQFWSTAHLDSMFSTVNDYYDPLNNGLGFPDGSYLEWQPYLVAHFGGYALQTGRKNTWNALQRDMRERNSFDRNRVFDQGLGVPSRVTVPNYEATSSSGSDQYISIPVVWRNYYDIVGFHRNRTTGELWLEPSIPEELNHELTNALVVSPEGTAVVDACESGGGFQNQRIKFKPDQLFRIDTIYVRDTFGDRVDYVRINERNVRFIREGVGYQKRLRILWSGIVGARGLTIEAAGDQLFPESKRPQLMSPLNGATQVDTTPTFVWHELGGAVDYRIEVASDSLFETVVAAARGLTDTTYTPAAKLAEGSKYWWRVSATIGEAISPYSRIWSFETVAPPPVISRIRVMLEGPYNVSTHAMEIALNSSGILSGQFPNRAVPAYAVDSINVGLRPVASSAISLGRLSSRSSKKEATMQAELPGAAAATKLSTGRGNDPSVSPYLNHPGAGAMTLIEWTQPAWLLTDGSLRCFTDTTKDYLEFPVASSAYQIVVRHRNHLAVMSADSVVLTPDTAVVYDFTTGLDKAYGRNAMKELGPGIFGLYAGDANQSAIISASDANLVFGMLNSTGYHAADINLSGVVSASDANVVLGNLSISSQVTRPTVSEPLPPRDKRRPLDEQRNR